MTKKSTSKKNPFAGLFTNTQLAVSLGWNVGVHIACAFAGIYLTFFLERELWQVAIGGILVIQAFVQLAKLHMGYIKAINAQTDHDS